MILVSHLPIFYLQEKKLGTNRKIKSTTYTKMRHYYCSHGKCNINGRKNPNAKFVTIPPRKSCPDRAQKWIDLLCRRGFTVDNITKNTKLCELHFPEDVDLDHRKNPTLGTIL